MTSLPQSLRSFIFLIRYLLPWNPKQLSSESKPNSSYNIHAYIIINHIQAKPSVTVVVNKVEFPNRSFKRKDYCKHDYSKYKEQFYIEHMNTKTNNTFFVFSYTMKM